MDENQEASFLDADDFSMSETEETTEETTEEVAVEDTKPAVETFKVKVNKEEKELTRDELIANAQKGMDYDRVKKQVEDLRNSPELTYLEQKAREAGMPRDQYIKALIQAEQEGKIAEMKQDLMDKGLDEETAEDVARTKFENFSLKTKDQMIRQTQQQKDAEQARINQEIEALIAEFPEVANMDKLPDEVIEILENNPHHTPLSAYQKYQLVQEQQKNKTLAQNEKNKVQSTGSVETTSTAEEDPFLQGFWSK